MWQCSGLFPVFCLNYRSVSRTLSNIYEGAFCENSSRFLTVKYFCKKTSNLEVWLGFEYVCELLLNVGKYWNKREHLQIYRSTVIISIHAVYVPWLRILHTRESNVSFSIREYLCFTNYTLFSWETLVEVKVWKIL